MGRAIQNERLAVRQRLTELYSRSVTQARSNLEDRWRVLLRRLGGDLPESPAMAFKRLTLECCGEPRLPRIRVAVIASWNGQIQYPDGQDELHCLEGVQDAALGEAMRAEYANKDPNAAAKIYSALALAAPEPAVRLAAAAGAFRCLSLAGKPQEAVALVHGVLRLLHGNGAFAACAARLRMGALEIMANTSMPGLDQEVQGFLTWILDYNDCQVRSAMRVFLLSRLIALCQGRAIESIGQEQVEQAKILLDAERAGLEALQALGEALSGLADRPEGQVFGLPNEQVLGLTVHQGRHRLVLIFDRQSMVSWISGVLSDSLPPGLGLRICDESGRLDRPMDDQEVALASLPLGRFWPSWQMDSYIKPDLPSIVAARRQQMVYIWTAAIVVMVSLATGIVGTKAMIRQIRLNRLRNDFIATIAHELKTPLASIRLLTDTLLDGKVQGPDKIGEYLALVAKENVRLSSLVDNFLTFSRMERNRCTFDMEPVDPVKVVHDAVNAIRSKWNHADCHLDLQFEPDLPMLWADQEALVTVLVNLLDNAFKYTGDQKRIAVRVNKEGTNVAISVSDNGVGIPRWSLRRVFDKFYQVDRTLARKAGGCGLGLSIVRFIVNAHHGSISVKSSLGQGSVFTVRLPSWRPS